MTMTLAPAATAMRAPSMRSRATTVGATRASKSGSSPTSSARCRAGSTRSGPARRPPYPRLKNIGRSPACASSRASANAVGVLPPPPTVKLPAQTTGTPARRPGAPRRRSATVPQTIANGASKEEARPASPHQNEGSRIACSALQPNLHEIRFECSQRAFEPAPERGHRLTRGLGHGLALLDVLEPVADPLGKRIRVRDLLRAMRPAQRGIDFSEVPDVGSMQNGRAQLDRIDRILGGVTRPPAADPPDRR